MKKRFNTLVLTLVACYCLSILPMIFTGCANSSGGSGSGSGNENNSAVSVSSVIGAAGGQVGDENASITIPAGALDADTTITVKYLPKEEELTEAPMLGFAGAVEFGPSGTKFNSPAEVMVKLTQTPKNTALSIFCYDEENDRWQYESDAEIKNGYAKFEVNHFSKYRIVDITPGLLQKYFDIIKSNFENKIPDTVSREQYKDYLINTVKVLDSYEIWGGRLYKACGFLISANYYIDGVEDDPNDLIDLVGKDTDRVKTGDLLYCKSKAKVSNSGSTESQIIMHTLLAIYYEPVTTYEISGHIKEEKEFSFEIYDYDYQYSMTVNPGTTKLTFDYDVSGFFFVEDGKINGSLEYKNVKAIIQSSAATAHYQSGDTHTVLLLKSPECSYSNYKCDIYGTCDDFNRCEIKYNQSSKNLVDLSGSTYVTWSGSPVIPDGDETFSGDSSGYLSVGGKDNKALLSFYLDPSETQENSLSDFKDAFYLCIWDEIEVQDSQYTATEIRLLSHSEKTEQKITLKEVTEDN